jgi:hypothetical protein
VALVPLAVVACSSYAASTTPLGADAGADAASTQSYDAAQDIAVPPLTCDVATEKACGGICVRKDDPAYGCTPDKCEACAESAYVASFKCEANTCKVGACAAGRADCDNVGKNGCETDLSTAPNCGKCANVCASSTPLCGQQGCVSSCAATTPDTCGNTCTNLASDASNCGVCGKVCAAPSGGSAKCINGMCGAVCPAGMKLAGTACVTDSEKCFGVGAATRSTVVVNVGQCCSNTVVSLVSGDLKCVCHGAGGQCKTPEDCCGAACTLRALGALGTCQ